MKSWLGRKDRSEWQSYFVSQILYSTFDVSKPVFKGNRVSNRCCSTSRMYPLLSRCSTNPTPTEQYICKCRRRILNAESRFVNTYGMCLEMLFIWKAVQYLLHVVLLYSVRNWDKRIQQTLMAPSPYHMLVLIRTIVVGSNTLALSSFINVPVQYCSPWQDGWRVGGMTALSSNR